VYLAVDVMPKASTNVAEETILGHALYDADTVAMGSLQRGGIQLGAGKMYGL
jgi:hypothetical protein